MEGQRGRQLLHSEDRLLPIRLLASFLNDESHSGDRQGSTEEHAILLIPEGPVMMVVKSLWSQEHNPNPKYRMEGGDRVNQRAYALTPPAGDKLREAFENLSRVLDSHAKAAEKSTMQLKLIGVQAASLDTVSKQLEAAKLSSTSPPPLIAVFPGTGVSSSLTGRDTERPLMITHPSSRTHPGKPVAFNFSVGKGTSNAQSEGEVSVASTASMTSPPGASKEAEDSLSCRVIGKYNASLIHETGLVPPLSFSKKSVTAGDRTLYQWLLKVSPPGLGNAMIMVTISALRKEIKNALINGAPQLSTRARYTMAMFQLRREKDMSLASKKWVPAAMANEVPGYSNGKEEMDNLYESITF
ncbi:hypothetical protein BT69DRAFT_1299902 [Atractiella rhizophila]|nr:hypothetical protein BT69DRAFT_1299902 [Atractiella rhizophila]